MNALQRDAEADASDYLKIISRRRRMVFLVTALGVSIMAAYALRSQPVFQATALVSVEKVGSDVAAPNGERQDSDERYI
jgi:uncharacterized protein involved in exopolysaccharide biosynthesis